LLKSIPGSIGQTLQHQYKIFGNKHTWVMSVIYTMTFGSFIGFLFSTGLKFIVSSIYAGLFFLKIWEMKSNFF